MAHVTANVQEHILLVDHMDQRRDVVTQLLKERNYSVVEASTCEDAIEILVKGSITLILTETELPSKSGLFLLKSAKETNPELEVILLTHNASSYNLLQALRLGAYDFIVRPIDTGEILYNAVERALGHIRLRRQNKELLAELEENNSYLRSSLKMMKALNESIERLASKLDIEDLLMELISSAMREIQAQRGFLALYDKSGDILRLKVGERISADVCRRYAGGIPDGLAKEIARRGKPLLVPADFPESMNALAGQEESKNLFARPGLVAAPLHLKGRIVGIIILSGYKNRSPLGDHDLHFLIQLSHHAALAMQKTGIIHQLKRGKVPVGMTPDIAGQRPVHNVAG